MADFVQMMKDWRRMCNFVPGKSESKSLCSDKESGYVCPLKYNGLCCKAVASQTDEDVISGENIIAKWAAEHPVVYPTWYEFLTKRYHKAWEAVGCDSIPADIAEKLGMEPKEG